MMDYSKKHDISVYLTEEQLNERIAQMGAEITKKFAGESVYLVCILKGSIFFTTELAKRIELPMTIDFMSVSSYGSETKSSGVVKIIKDLDEPLKDKNVIVIEDIVDSGRTLSDLLDMLKARGPKSMALCTLLDKPSGRKVDLEPDYTCFTIPAAFVVGFGLDYEDYYRNLPYVGVKKTDNM